MGQLSEIALRAFAIATILAAACCGAGPSYCSLIVRVTAPDGHRPEVLVTVEEPNGRRTRHYQEGSEVRFCDLGGLPVTVKVGVDGGCNEIIVRNVPVAWNAPYVLPITYDPSRCLAERPAPPVPICRLVVRVADARGRWLAGGNITIKSPKPMVLTTDEFGRASMVSEVGEDVRGSVTVPGYEVMDFHFACSRSEPVHEELLRLTESVQPAR